VPWKRWYSWLVLQVVTSFPWRTCNYQTPGIARPWSQEVNLNDLLAKAKEPWPYYDLSIKAVCLSALHLEGNIACRPGFQAPPGSIAARPIPHSHPESPTPRHLLLVNPRGSPSLEPKRQKRLSHVVCVALRREKG